MYDFEGSGRDLYEMISSNWLAETEKTEKTAQGNRYPGQDSNRALPEYNFRALPLD
jgi:hypothetical protein